MSPYEMTTLIWISGWALTALAFFRARKKHSEAEWQYRDRQVTYILDILSVNLVVSAFVFLLLWPVCIVSFCAMMLLPGAMKRKAEFEAEERAKEREEATSE